MQLDLSLSKSIPSVWIVILVHCDAFYVSVRHTIEIKGSFVECAICSVYCCWSTSVSLVRDDPIEIQFRDSVFTIIRSRGTVTSCNCIDTWKHSLPLSTCDLSTHHQYRLYVSVRIVLWIVFVRSLK